MAAKRKKKKQRKYPTAWRLCHKELVPEYAVSISERYGLNFTSKIKYTYRRYLRARPDRRHWYRDYYEERVETRAGPNLSKMLEKVRCSDKELIILDLAEGAFRIYDRLIHRYDRAVKMEELKNCARRRREYAKKTEVARRRREEARQRLREERERKRVEKEEARKAVELAKTIKGRGYHRNIEL